MVSGRWLDDCRWSVSGRWVDGGRLVGDEKCVGGGGLVDSGEEMETTSGSKEGG